MSIAECQAFGDFSAYWTCNVIMMPVSHLLYAVIALGLFSMFMDNTALVWVAFFIFAEGANVGYEIYYYVFLLLVVIYRFIVYRFRPMVEGKTK